VLVRRAQDHRDAARWIDDVLEVGEALVLLGVVVQRVGAPVRRLDSEIVGEIAAGDEVV